MARAVAGSMSDDEVLLFEAGTGVGKSLAYLVPGILHAMDQTRQMIVSTHTISLQEQIETKDLPLCRRLFESVDELRPYAKFKSALLVGKATTFAPPGSRTPSKAATNCLPRPTTRNSSASPPGPGNRARASGMNSIRRRHPTSGRRSTQILPPAATRIAAASIVLPAGARPPSPRPGHHCQPQPALRPPERRRRRGKRRHTPASCFPTISLSSTRGNTVPEIATDHFGCT